MANFDRLCGGFRAFFIFLEAISVTCLIIQIATTEDIFLFYRSPEMLGSVFTILTCGCGWFVSVETYDGKAALTKSMRLCRLQRRLPASSPYPDEAKINVQRLCGGVRSFWLFISVYILTLLRHNMRTTEKLWLHLCFYQGVIALLTCGYGYMISLLTYDVKNSLAQLDRSSAWVHVWRGVTESLCLPFTSIRFAGDTHKILCAYIMVMRKSKTLRRKVSRKSKQRRQRGGLIFSRASCRKALNRPTRYNSPYRVACQIRYGDSNLRGHERLIDAFGNADFRPKRNSTAFTVGYAPRSRAPPSSVNPLFLKSHGLRSVPLTKRTYLQKKTYQVPAGTRKKAKTSLLAPVHLYKEH